MLTLAPKLQRWEEPSEIIIKSSNNQDATLEKIHPRSCECNAENPGAELPEAARRIPEARGFEFSLQTRYTIPLAPLHGVSTHTVRCGCVLQYPTHQSNLCKKSLLH